MDSVVQAAGRCNRSGEAGPDVVAPVHLVQCRDESLRGLPDIQAGKDATLELLCEFQRDPAQFQYSLSSDAAIFYYYRVLYQRMSLGHQDRPIPKKPYTLFSLLAQNEAFAAADCADYTFHQAFRTAGALFQVFDQETTDVLVSYEKGAEIIAALHSDRAKYDLAYARSQLELAKPYTVSLYQYQVEALKHALRPLHGGAVALIGHYEKDIGFTMEDDHLDYLEV